MAYFAADPIFLLVQRALLSLCNVAMVLRSHETFFTPHSAILPMKSTHLTAIDFTLVQFAVDPMGLVREAMIYLGAAGMALCPCLGGSIADAGQKCDRRGENGNTERLVGREHFEISSFEARLPLHAEDRSLDLNGF
jgi:hypothetical protein